MNPDETQKLIIDESAAARQLRAGFPWLRFEKDLEREFRREQVRARLPQVRSNLFLATAIVFAFGMLNTLVLGTTIHSSMYWLQFGMVLPPIGVLLALTYHRAAYRVYQRYAPFVVAFIGLAVVLVESRAAQAGVQILFVGVLLCSVYVYYLVGLLFYEALRANALIWCTYLMVAIFSALPEAGVLYNTLVLLIANIVGATAAYSFEMETRTHFLEQRMLAETAARDGLTGLYNRRRFDEHLVTVWQMAQREGVTLALLCVANDRPIKGLAVLLDAVEQHVASDNWQLDIVGQCGEAIRHRIAQSPKLQQYVVAHGFRSDVPDFFRAAHIYIQPTLQPGEGIGNSMAEAMSFSLPVITSNVGGGIELIEHERTGIHFEVGNPVALGQAIDRLIQDPVACDALGQAAAQTLQTRFSLHNEALAFVALFKQVMARSDRQ